MPPHSTLTEILLIPNLAC